jgi:hypothetical protein
MKNCTCCQEHPIPEASGIEEPVKAPGSGGQIEKGKKLGKSEAGDAILTSLPKAAGSLAVRGKALEPSETYGKGQAINIQPSRKAYKCQHCDSFSHETSNCPKVPQKQEDFDVHDSFGPNGKAEAPSNYSPFVYAAIQEWKKDPKSGKTLAQLYSKVDQDASADPQYYQKLGLYSSKGEYSDKAIEMLTSPSAKAYWENLENNPPPKSSLARFLDGDFVNQDKGLSKSMTVQAGAPNCPTVQAGGKQVKKDELPTTPKIDPPGGKMKAPKPAFSSKPAGVPSAPKAPQAPGAVPSMHKGMMSFGAGKTPAAEGQKDQALGTPTSGSAAIAKPVSPVKEAVQSFRPASPGAAGGMPKAKSPAGLTNIRRSVK